MSDSAFGISRELYTLLMGDNQLENVGAVKKAVDELLSEGDLDEVRNTIIASVFLGHSILEGAASLGGFDAGDFLSRLFLQVDTMMTRRGQ